jgi:hypothetical protein
VTDDEKVGWSMDLLNTFSDRWGFPKNPRALRLFCAGFLEIVGPVVERREPAERGGEKIICEARTLEEQGEWLIEEAYRSTKRCPTLIELRQIYESKYVPADGRSAESMALEE